MKKLASYALLMGGLIGLVLYGGLYEAQWAINIVVFVTWVLVLLGAFVALTYFLISCMASHFVKVGEYEKVPGFNPPNPTVPRWLDVGIDFSIAFMMAYFGWVVTAIVYTVHIFLIQGIIWPSKESIAKDQAEAQQMAVDDLVRKAGGR